MEARLARCRLGGAGGLLRSVPLLLLCACPMQVDNQGAATPAPASAPPPAAVAPSPAGPGAAEVATSPSAPPPGADGVPIRIDVQPPDEDEPRWTQAKLASADHVTLSGTVRCEACGAGMVLRALPFQAPDTLQLGDPPSPLTVLPIKEQGQFSILVPRGTKPIVLELLVDLDGDGYPDRGERMSVVVRDGKLIPDHDQPGFTIDATDSEAGPWPTMGPDNAPKGG